MCQVGESAQRVPTAQELGTAHREQLLSAKPGNVEPWRGAVAVPDRDIDILAREIDVVKRGAYPEVDRWVDLGKTAKTMHEPFGREVGGRTDGENPGALALKQTVGSGGDATRRGRTRRRGDRADVECVRQTQGRDSQSILRHVAASCHGDGGRYFANGTHVGLGRRARHDRPGPHRPLVANTPGAKAREFDVSEWVVPEPHQSFDLTMEDGAVIRVRTHGNPDGPSLVLCHGNGFASDGLPA